MTEQGPTRLLAARPLSGRVLLLDPPDAESVAALRDALSSDGDGHVLTAWTFDVRRESFASLFGANGSASASASASASGAGAFDTALVYLSKGKARQHWLLDVARWALGAEGEVRVAGGKREGIRSIRTAVAERFTEALGVTSGGHAQCIVARSPKKDAAGATDHPLAMAAYEQEATMDVPGGPLRCVWYPGVYGAEKLDEGSALLLETLAPRVAEGELDSLRRVLDVGCGSGLLGAWVARSAIARGLDASGLSVDLVDIDAFSLGATRATLARVLGGTSHGAPPEMTRVWGSDVYSAVPDRYDWIISNPPFHDGVGTSYDAALRLIREAPAHLRPGGRLTLVANSFLPYRDALDQTFGSHRVLAETPRFRVYEANRR